MLNGYSVSLPTTDTKASCAMPYHCTILPQQSSITISNNNNNNINQGMFCAVQELSLTVSYLSVCVRTKQTDFCGHPLPSHRRRCQPNDDLMYVHAQSEAYALLVKRIRKTNQTRGQGECSTMFASFDHHCP